MNSNANHTQGPWNVGPKSPDGSYPIISKVTRCIGEVRNPFLNDDKGQTAANATLIASAPELLSALKAIMTDCDLKVIGHGGRMDQAIINAQNVILKAEGK